MLHRCWLDPQQVPHELGVSESVSGLVKEDFESWVASFENARYCHFGVSPSAVVRARPLLPEIVQHHNSWQEESGGEEMGDEFQRMNGRVQGACVGMYERVKGAYNGI
jgi:hypothetical protein